jgi:hypothetical protein
VTTQCFIMRFKRHGSILSNSHPISRIIFAILAQYTLPSNLTSKPIILTRQALASNSPKNLKTEGNWISPVTRIISFFIFVGCVLLLYIIALSKYTYNRNWNSYYFSLSQHFSAPRGHLQVEYNINYIIIILYYYCHQYYNGSVVVLMIL